MIVLASSGVARAAPQDDAAFEQAAVEELRAVAPDAVPAFERANAAYFADELGTAAEGYRDVLRAAPSFDHAQRRLCVSLERTGHREEAGQWCRRALNVRRSPQNLVALAMLLTGAEGSSGKGVWREAATYLREATRADRNDPRAWLVRGVVAARLGDAADLDESVRALVSLAPDEATTHWLHALSHANHEAWDRAEAELDEAEARGFDATSIAELRAAIDEARPASSIILPIAGWVSLVWASWLLLLFAVGAILSRVALRSAAELPTDATGRAQGGTAALQRAYRTVLWLSCATYYISLPIVLALVVGLASGLIYVMLQARYVSIKLLLIAGVVGLVTLIAVLRSFFVRASDEDPGERLDLAEHPRLRALLDEVAEVVGTRPVDTVFATAGADAAVFERGSTFAQLRGGERERCLILGVALLDALDQRELKSILAHEYGHFSNADTSGGALSLTVRRSILMTAMGLARSGAATWYNPAWLFVQGFYRIFLRISQGASRLQEVLADRWAAFKYGPETFVRAYQGAVRAGVRFDQHAGRTLDEVVETGTPLPNLYRFRPAEAPTDREIDAAVAEILAQEPSPYDSHPSAEQRFDLVRRLTVDPALDATEDEGPACDLLEGFETLQERITASIRARVLEGHGVVIWGSDAEREAAEVE